MLLHKFIATVQEYKDEHYSVFHAYALNEPALSEDAFSKAKVIPGITRWWYAGLSIIVLIIVLIIIYYRYRRHRHFIQTSDIANITDEFKVQPNSIYLFGNFQAFNAKGQDISFMFTDKLRQIVCLMLQYGKEGIPSRQMPTVSGRLR